MKKFLMFTMIAMMLLCIVCVATACGETGGNKNDNSEPQPQPELFDYILDESGDFYWVTRKSGNLTQEVVVIPSEHDGLPVKGIANLIVDNSFVKEIVIPESIEKIEMNSFWHLTKLEKITYNAINAEVYNSAGEVKGEMLAYVDYENLTIKELIIGNKVKHLPALFEDGSFNITIIEELTIPASVETSNLNLKIKKSSANKPLKVNISSVEQWLKIFCQKGNRLDESSAGIDLYVNGAIVEEMTIPDSITKLTERRAFLDVNTKDLKKVKIHAGVDTIYSDVLDGDNLQIEVDENNPYFASRNGILYNKDFTKAITIPRGISGEVTIPSTAFLNMGESVFAKCQMRKLVVECPWTVIASYNLFGCDNLETLVINDCTTINRSAFSDCKKLKTIILPENLTKIEGIICEDSTDATLYCKATTKDNIEDKRTTEEKARVKLLVYSETKPTDNASAYWHFDTDGKTPIAWA